MQYTGLKDKHGHEIYEGDIVELQQLNGYGKRQVIFFSGGAFVMNAAGTPHKPSVAVSGYTVQVVGNIYEHPDLVPRE